MRSQVHIHAKTSKRIGTFHASLFAIVMLLAGSASTFAEQSIPPVTMMLSYPSGTITALYETTFQIDGRTYGLTADAIILDRHGDPLKASDLRVDIAVKFHLLKGTTDKIDQIILFLPL